MKKNFALLFWFAFLWLPAMAQPGSLDTSFLSNSAFDTGFDGQVNKVVVQPDGRILVAGFFTSFFGAPARGLCRLMPDGSLDNSFATGASFGTPDGVRTINLLADGSILAGGNIATYNGTATNTLVKINSDGTLDAGFPHTNGITGTINAIAVQPDGRIVVGGQFYSFGATTIRHLARLNANGSLDTDFNVSGNLFPPPNGYTDRILDIALQPNGSMIVVGSMGYSSAPRKRGIARVNPNGTLDTSFNVVDGFQINTGGSTQSTVKLLPDGKILVGGIFNSYNNNISKGMVRLTADGDFDSSFNIGSGFSPTYDIQGVKDFTIQPDGKIIAGGNFISFQSHIARGIVRLTENGSHDNTFVTADGFPTPATVTIALQPDGKILTGGLFYKYQNHFRNNLARLHNDNTVSSPGLVSQNALNLTLGPNPTNGIFTATLQIQRPQQADFTLTDIAGKVVRAERVQLQAGENEVKLDLGQNQPAGTYLLQIRSGEQTINSRIIKQ